MSDTAAVPFLPYGRQTIDDQDVAAVVSALQAPLITQGPLVDRFEEALAGYVGARHVTVCASGTAALHLAYLALGLGPGDEIITSPVTFVATAAAAIYCGARVRFADVDPDAGLISPGAVEALVGPNTRGIVAVHLGGLPADLAALREIADRKRLWLVEDAAHALGATYRGKPVGCGEYCHASVFSFHPVKHITTGEGGAVAVTDHSLKRSMDQLRHHGIERDPSRYSRPSPGPWYHEVQRVGFNYRLTDLQCALGLSQLARQPSWLSRRRAIAARYREGIQKRGLGGRVRVQRQPEDRESAWHLFPVLVNFQESGRTRAELMEDLKARGIGTQVHYIPVTEQPAYRTGEDLPGARRWYERELSLPMYPALKDDQVDRVLDGLAVGLKG